MSKATAIAVFLLLWWVSLFAVLPWGVRSQQEDGTVVPGTDPGAPILPAIGRKLVWTTLVAAILWSVLYIIITDRLVTVSGILAVFGLHSSQ